MLASSIFRAAIVSVLVSAISIRGTLTVSVFVVSTLPGAPPANAIFGIAVASGSLAGAGRTAASADDEGESLILLCLPMGDPRCGGELDPMAVTNPLPFRGLPALAPGRCGPPCRYLHERSIRHPSSDAESAARLRAPRNCRST